MTAAEVAAHPEYPHTNWVLEPTKRESIPVAAGRGGPLNITCELHGHGPNKIIWIMGLGGFMRQWQRQTKDFGHTQRDKYTCLVFDNRGMGDSDAPLLRYTTSEMARDTVELLDHVGWTGEREVHVVGISMGGMIAQELAVLIPTRICSLNLISTAPRIVRTLPFLENVRNRINMVIPKGLDEQVEKLKKDLYSDKWLELPDETEYVVKPFPTNGDRYVASEISKRTEVPSKITRTGFLCQLVAAGWHHKSAEQLEKIGDEVGRERILVFHGTRDGMVDFVHGEMLLKDLGGEERGVTKYFVEGLGHVAPVEIRKEFNALIEGRIAKTSAMPKK